MQEDTTNRTEQTSRAADRAGPSVPDHYPSRVLPEPKIFHRTDPVVWTDDWDDGWPLTRAEIQQFERDGFLFFPNVFYLKEIEELQAELDRLAASDEIKRQEEAVVEPEGNELRSLFDVHKNNDLLRTFARSRRLVDIVSQLLGSEVYMHQSRVNYKPGFEGKEFDWHSDFETWHVEDGMPRPRAISCSIWLEANTAYNGSLMVVPGSHKYFVSCVGETPEDNYKQSLKKQKTGVPDQGSLKSLVDRCGMQMPTGPAGSVLFFECNIMHGSPSNISPWPRSNVFFCYNSVENTLVEPFGAPKRRPEFIARRDVTPIRPL